MKKITKKTVVLLLLIVCISLLTACGKDKKDSDGDNGVPVSSADTDGHESVVDSNEGKGSLSQEGAQSSSVDNKELKFQIAHDNRRVIVKFMDLSESNITASVGEWTYLVIRHGYEGIYDKDTMCDLLYRGMNTGQEEFDVIVTGDMVFVEVIVPDTCEDFGFETNERFSYYTGDTTDNSVYFSADEVVVDMAKMESDRADAVMQAKREYIAANAKGDFFDLPEGFENHEGDVAYFFSTTDDYIVCKYDAVYIGLSLTEYGNCDIYEAYVYQEGIYEMPVNSFKKYVFDTADEASAYMDSLIYSNDVLVGNVIYFDPNFVGRTPKLQAIKWMDWVTVFNEADVYISKPDVGIADSDTDTSQAAPLDVSHIEVLGVTELLLAEEINITTSQSTFVVTNTEIREVKENGSDKETRAVAVYFDITNHTTDEELQRFMCADVIIWSEGMSLSEGLSSTEVGLSDPALANYIIKPGETASMVLIRELPEDSSLEGLALSVTVHGEPQTTKSKIPMMVK